MKFHTCVLVSALCAHFVFSAPTLEAPPVELTQDENLAKPIAGRSQEEMASPSPTPSEAPPLVFPDPIPDDDEREFDKSDERYQPGFLECPCSPTGRGFNSSTVLTSGRTTLLEGGRSAAVAAMARCIASHGVEACINWDAAQVLVGGARMCMADEETARNVVEVGGGRVRTVGPCTAEEETRSKPSSLAPLPKPTEVPDVPGSRAAAAETNLFEGCVAIEHLRGVRMQHRWNLWRRVLCAENGLCATPRHIMLVDGRHTSMKELCENTWRCRVESRWVNNIHITQDLWVPHGVRGDVLVTPYHAWIPPKVAWLLAITEDLMVPLLVSIVTGLMLIGLSVLLKAADNGKTSSRLLTLLE